MPWQNNIELIVLGAAGITCVYHIILYLHQRDKYLILYANYLFSLTIYLFFRQVSHYDSFEYSTNQLAFILDYPIILYMLVSYVFFISKVLEMHNNAFIIKLAVYAFYITSSILLLYHIYKIILDDQFFITRQFFAISKLVMLLWAFIGLYGAITLRKSIFVRTISIGGIAYATFSLFTVISVYYQITILSLYQYQLYFVGCLIDILLFSSALGYRNYLISQEKMNTQIQLINVELMNSSLLKDHNDLMQKKISRDAQLLNMHNTVQGEIGATLSSLHIYADLAIQKGNLPADTENYLLQISKKSKQLMDDIGDIIWLANLDMENIHKLFIVRLKNYATEIFQATEIEYQFKINPYFYQTKLNKHYLKEQLLNCKNNFKLVATNTSYSSVTIVLDCNNSKPIIEYYYQ